MFFIGYVFIVFFGLGRGVVGVCFIFLSCVVWEGVGRFFLGK